MTVDTDSAAGLQMNNPPTPWATLALLTFNAWVFVWLFALGASSALQVSYGFGLIPALVTRHAELESIALAAPPPVTFLTTVFLHRDLYLLSLDLAILALAGPRIERALGAIRFVVFYLACGVATGLAEVVHTPALNSPLLGGLGISAALLGALSLLCPRASIVLPGTPSTGPWVASIKFCALAWLAALALHAAFVPGSDVHLRWLSLPIGLITGGCLTLFLKRREVPLLR